MPSIDEWPHVVTEGDPDAPVFLTLHGTGGNEVEIQNLGRYLDPRATMISPRGLLSENGMGRWFRRIAEGVFDLDDVEFRAHELAGFIREARERYGLGDRELMAVGFSNGANIALATALLEPTALRTVISFSGRYPLGDREPATDLTGVDVIMLNGTMDPMAPKVEVDRAGEVLTRLGARVETAFRPGGHGLTEADVAAAREWLAARG